MAHIIVVGNEKGGAGKSTVSMHVATALARMGHKVSALDLDLRQRTFGRYSENRQSFLKNAGLDLPSPHYHELPEVDPADLNAGENIYDHRLSAAVADLEPNNDFILIDCPGSHTRLSQVAHSLADTLITPLNDSFIDFDLLAHTDATGDKITGPSVYSEMVWNARQLRAKAGLPPIDWVVVRNRMGAQRMVNKDKMERVIQSLSKRIGFRVAPGFNERVIFRELFPRGLTLLDLKDIGIKQLNISNIAARQELRDLIKALNLPGVDADFLMGNGAAHPVAVPRTLLRAPDKFGGTHIEDCQIGVPVIHEDCLVALEATTRTSDATLLIPALTDPHCHLDKCHTIGRMGSVAGDLNTAIAAQVRDKRHWTDADIRARATRGLNEARNAGVAALRSHVDWGEGTSAPAAWHVLRELAQEHSDITMQLSPLTGIERMAAPEFTRALAREAAAAGGALGAFVQAQPEMEAGISQMIAAALHYDLPLDFHVDEGLGDLNGLELIADLAIKAGFDGPILCGHAVSLIEKTGDDLNRITDKLVQAGIAVCALPTTNLYLQDRRDGTPDRRGLTRLRELRTAGVPVLTGSDNVADAFCPLGQFDPMAALHLAALTAHLDPPMARWLPMITTDARKAMGLAPLYVDGAHIGQLRLSRAFDCNTLVSGRSPLRPF